MEPNVTVDLLVLNDQLAALRSNADMFFLLIMACLIFFMQAGFAFLEAGSVRSKNTTNILLKNLLDVCLGAVVYWAFGYAFAFGSESNSFIGYRYFFFESMPADNYSHWFFHFVFAATAATIVSGAMAERTDFMAYLIYSCVITGFVYPVVTHWAWDGSGWLANGPDGIAYQDFAGSGVVHMVGGTAALFGAAILGPRIGRFDANGKPKPIEGHTVPNVALGGFILFFGFFAFNGGSQASISAEGDGVIVATAIVNTILSGSAGALVAMVIRRAGFGTGHWSFLTAVNGGLTGMVAICAGCNAVAAWGAIIIGIISGFTYLAWSWLVLKCKVDDPLDAVAVHLGGGLWGVISVPLLSYESGILTKWDLDSAKLLGWNLAGAGAIFGWSGLISLILFGVMRCIGILRVSEEIEIKGLDIYKHGEPAYPLSAYGHGWSVDVEKSGKHVNGNAFTNGGFDGVLPVQVFHVSNTNEQANHANDANGEKKPTQSSPSADGNTENTQM
ncbi:putative ammonium transporter 1 isoform X2 [Amphiura filiformis]|uniref:putative ammonium transporter 1 isoform X2 n=1 Tax=Amphiura filiformis TaxID=82378 RepID=UPI003B2282FA